jgi:Rod binding domain-containing protein
MNDLPPIASRPAGPPTGLQPPSEQPDSPEEAAKAFEKVLVRRFVKTMTEKMFDTTLSGADGPSWMSGQRDQQRDMMTDVLTDHIVASDTMGLRDMLLRDWEALSSQTASPSSPHASPSGP